MNWILTNISRKVKEMDPFILYSYLILIFVGLFIQLDIVSVKESMAPYIKQFILTIVAVFSAFAIYLFFPIKWIKSLWLFWGLYFLVLGLLIAVYLKSYSSHGANRLLPIQTPWGNFTVQPSLLARLVLVMLFTKIIYYRQHVISADAKAFFSSFWTLFVVSGFYYGLIYKQNHLSSILTSGFTMFSILFLAGAKKSNILILILVLLLLASGVILLQDGGEFRLKRLIDWFNNNFILRWIMGKDDASNIETNNYESFMCLSAGRFVGTTPDGSRGKYGFLYEAKTDFVYAIIGEEFGLLGMLVVLLTYLVLIYRGMQISAKQNDVFYKLLGYGFSLNLLFNVLIHVGTVTACFPTTGVTLPFLSHGGSSMIANSLAIGILLKLSLIQERESAKNQQKYYY